MKRIKIAHLITDLDIGGAELMLLKVLRNSDKNIYDHFVISLKQNGKAAKEMEKSGIRVTGLNMKWHNFPLRLIELCRILKKEKPDIAHSYLFHADIAGRICGRIAGVPLIVSSLRSVNAGGPFREALLRATDGLVDAVTAVSEKVALEHINKRTTKGDKIRVIYNGLELDNRKTENNKNELREKAGIPSGDFVILSVGSLRPAKGYSFIFDAIRMLGEGGKDAKLIIVGGGNYKKTLEADIVDKGISDKVVFAGEREDISDFLSMADVFVMASLWEGMPNALLEAMSAGLPVVATKVGGIPEVVRDNENGILAGPKDGRALAEAIERIMKSEALRKRLGENAKSCIKENFDIKRTVALTEKLYGEIASSLRSSQ